MALDLFISQPTIAQALSQIGLSMAPLLHSGKQSTLDSSFREARELSDQPHLLLTEVNNHAVEDSPPSVVNLSEARSTTGQGAGSVKVMGKLTSIDFETTN